MCLNQSGFFYLRCQRQGHLHRPLLLRISSVVFLNIYMPHTGRYIGNRPMRLRKSTWKDRNFLEVKKKEKSKKRLGFKV